MRPKSAGLQKNSKMNVLDAMISTYQWKFKIQDSHISDLCHRHEHASHILSFSSVLFFCKLIIPCLFCAVCPDGKASCSHNAVVIPPAHGALTPVNTLPIVSWTSFISPALVIPLCPRPAELGRLHTEQVSLPQPLSTGQGKPCVVVIWWCAICWCFSGMGKDSKAVLRVTHWRETLDVLTIN